MKKSVLLLAAVPFLFSCCGKIKQTTQSGESTVTKKTIGLSIDTLAIERWRRDCDVFLNTVRAKGCDVIVQNAGNSIEEQRRQIEYLVNKKVNVIVIVAKKSDSLVEQVNLCHANNIPVISYDRLIRDCNIELYITIDSQKVGEAMGQELLKYNPYGTWYCMYGPQDDFNMSMINKGLLKAITGSQVRIGYVYYTEGWNYDLAYHEMKNLINQNKIPNAVVCGNDAVANSVIQVFQEKNPGRMVYIAGQDADIVNCQHIINGRQTLTVYKPITELAKLSGNYAVEMAYGKKAKDFPLVTQSIHNGYGEIPAVMLEPVTVTKDNIDEIIIKSGFHTYEEVYQN